MPTSTPIRARLRGFDLINAPLLNKGSAFSESERAAFGLDGLLPPAEETIETQVERTYDAYRQKTTDLERHIYLRALQDINETLFVRLITEHLVELMPIIYTPVVGLGCQKFSQIYRRPRGLFVSYPLRDRLDKVLASVGDLNVGVIVVTDGERILGLGDQGAGGMAISIGKLSLYSACGGISPDTTLPIVLDVGTNNRSLLDDPLYIGWRHERIAGKDYEGFVDEFVEAVKRRWPKVLLQFEDFAQHHATLFLERYRDRLCMFNDDIQGTAAAVVGALLAAVNVTGTKLEDQRVVIVGAGSAGCGIAEQTIRTMIEAGADPDEARARFYMVDRDGLLHDGMNALLPFQQRLVQKREVLQGWRVKQHGRYSLMETIEHARPTVLIGASGQPGIFDEALVKRMGQTALRPIIFPLSNPTSRCEALPSDLIAWTEGRALVATGSPFDPVPYAGRTYPIAQSNNSYVFPGLGLAVRAFDIPRVSDGMLMAACRALSQASPARKDPSLPLLPSLADIRAVSVQIAIATARAAIQEKLIPELDDKRLVARIEEARWEPVYRSMIPA